TNFFGNFSFSFKPNSNEAGHYTCGAKNPGDPSFVAQDSFSIVGMRFVDNFLIYRLSVGSQTTIYPALRNLGTLTINGIGISNILGPNNLISMLAVTPPNSLASKQTLAVPIEINAVDGANGGVTINLE